MAKDILIVPLQGEIQLSGSDTIHTLLQVENDASLNYDDKVYISASNIGIGTSEFPAEFAVEGEISSSGDITTDGNIVVDSGTVDGVYVFATSQSVSTRLTTNESDIDDLEAGTADLEDRMVNEEATSSALITDYDYVQSLGTNDTVVFDDGTFTTIDVNGGTVDGLTALSIANDVDVGNFIIRAKNFRADEMTSGRVAFYGTNGIFSHDSDFTFSTDTLTVTKIGAFQAVGSIDFNNQNMTNVDIDTGDVASAVVINKSPTINFNSGDVQGSLTLDLLASGTGELTIQPDSVEGTMLNINAADTTTLELSSDTLSVLKVPNALSPGTNLNLTDAGTFDGSVAKTINLDASIYLTSVDASGEIEAGHFDIDDTVVINNSKELLNITKATIDFIELDGNAISATNGGGLYLYDDNSHGIFIQDGGNVGIGTTTPSKELTVTGEVSASGNIQTDGNLIVIGNSILYERVGADSYMSGFVGHG